MIIIGTLKGNGAGFTKLLERLIRGAWTPTAMEFMQPSLWVIRSFFLHWIVQLCVHTVCVCSCHEIQFKIFEFSQLHKGVGCCINHFRIGQKDRIDFSTTCIGLLWHCHFLGLLQIVVDFIGHSWSVCAIWKPIMCSILRRYLGQFGQTIGTQPSQRRTKRCKEIELKRFTIQFYPVLSYLSPSHQRNRTRTLATETVFFLLFTITKRAAIIFILIYLPDKIGLNNQKQWRKKISKKQKLNVLINTLGNKAWNVLLMLNKYCGWYLVWHCIHNISHCKCSYEPNRNSYSSSIT